MTFQAARLLRKLKKAQQTENGTIHIDGKNLKACTHQSNCLKPVEVSLSRYRTSLTPTLKLLHDNNLIEHRTTFTQVTSKGWHYGQEKFFNFCSFMIKSVITPIVVSVITTLITIWLGK